MDMNDDSSSTMAMVFSSWSTYKTSLLFASWKCSTRLEFALSWFAVVFAAIVYHAVRFLVFMIEDYMHSESPAKVKAISDEQLNGYQYSSGISADPLINENREREILNPAHTSKRRGETSSSNLENTDQENEASRYLLLRLLHSILSGCNYGVALMLMLIAMTFNPSLFLALVIGYSVGDFIFFARMRPQSSISDCH